MPRSIKFIQLSLIQRLSLNYLNECSRKLTFCYHTIKQKKNIHKITFNYARIIISLDYF